MRELSFQPVFNDDPLGNYMEPTKLRVSDPI